MKVVRIGVTPSALLVKHSMRTFLMKSVALAMAIFRMSGSSPSSLFGTSASARATGRAGLGAGCVAVSLDSSSKPRAWLMAWEIIDLA